MQAEGQRRIRPYTQQSLPSRRGPSAHRVDPQDDLGRTLRLSQETDRCRGSSASTLSNASIPHFRDHAEYCNHFSKERLDVVVLGLRTVSCLLLVCADS